MLVRTKYLLPRSHHPSLPSLEELLCSPPSVPHTQEGLPGPTAQVLPFSSGLDGPSTLLSASHCFLCSCLPGLSVSWLHYNGLMAPEYSEPKSQLLHKELVSVLMRCLLLKLRSRQSTVKVGIQGIGSVQILTARG